MKKTILSMLMTVLVSMFMTMGVYAQIGDMGYFGGISEGTSLPKTMEEIVTSSKKKKNTTRTMEYKEIIFLSGKPVEFVGSIEVEAGEASGDSGTYEETYTISPSKYSSDEVSIDREIVFVVTYEKVPSLETLSGYQIVKNYAIDSWKEKIVVDGTTYTLDEDKSYYTRIANEESEGGVKYVTSNVNSRAVYTTDGENEQVIKTIYGEAYGYDQAWSSTETQRMNCTIDYRSASDSWQMQVQLRPSVTVNKVLQYSPNEPSITSFTGNYYEVLQRQNALYYDILAMPSKFERDVEKSGMINIETFNDIEALRVPSALSLVALKGNAAEEDIKQLYSMGVLDNPQYFVPSQGITRSQFITALVKAVKLPVEETVTTTKTSSRKNSKKNTATVEYLFQDFSSEREEYKYIKAAYNAGITIGRDNGKFRPDEIVTKEEAFCLILRALGVKNQAYASVPYTAFVDNDEISDWAKNEIAYMAKLGIISADEEGKMNPKDQLSKAEGAALINSFVKYMREKMQVDYVENLIYYIN